MTMHQTGIALDLQNATGSRSDVLRRAAIRLIPFLAALYFISYLDRVNISFAALQMNGTLGLSASQYGAGAGIFFLGYLAFQVPSNILLQRYGARRWLAIIILAWGIASLSMSFINSPQQFYLARFALGVGEAGFFPGLVLYLTYWFPPQSRGRIMSGLLLSIPLASVVGAPISNAILVSFDGSAGWEAWRWLFLVESIPAIFAAGLVWIVLPDGPAQASWLTSDEKRWLADQLQHGTASSAGAGTRAIRALVDPRVILFAMAYFGLGLGLYGIGLWLPQIIKASGASQSGAVLLTAIPYSAAAVAMVIWGRIADRHPASPRNCWLPTLISALALGLLPMCESLTARIALLSLAAAGTLSAIAVFWTLPTVSIPPKSLGVVVAAINTMGSVGGFLGPFAVGWLKDMTESFAAGIALLALGSLVSAILLMMPRARPPAAV